MVNPLKFSLLATIASLFMFSCNSSLKEQDFYGEYHFLRPDKVMSKNKMAPAEGSAWLKTHPSIHYYELSPINIEIFGGDGLTQGKMNIEVVQTYAFRDTYTTKSIPLILSKFRINGDTLYFEADHKSAKVQALTMSLIKKQNMLLGYKSSDLLEIPKSIYELSPTFVNEYDDNSYWMSCEPEKNDSLRIVFFSEQIQENGLESDWSEYDQLFIEELMKSLEK